MEERLNRVFPDNHILKAKEIKIPIIEIEMTLPLAERINVLRVCLITAGLLIAEK